MVKIGDIVKFKDHGTSDRSGYKVVSVYDDGRAIIELVSSSHLKLQMQVMAEELVVLF